MSRVDIIRHPKYRVLCIFHIIIAVIMIGYNAIPDYSVILSYWQSMIIFIAFLGIGNFFHKRFEDPFVRLINESFSFAAMLSYGATFATAALLIPWIIPIFFYSNRSKLEELSQVSILIVKLYLAYFIFQGFASIFNLNTETSIVFAAGGAISGISMLALEAIANLTNSLAKGESLKLFKAEIIDRTTKVPLLWSWGLIFAHLIQNKSYLFAILMIIPIIILYLYILKRRQLENTVEKALDSITYMVGLRDSYTYQHSKNVEQYSHTLALAMGLSDKEANKISQIAVLHDIGKVGIRDNVLLKSGGLTDEEWKEMTRHPELGANLIKLIGILNIDIDGIRYHHERWDGRGYPSGLKGEQIPLSARIISICDAWNAMRSNRPYRKALHYDEAIKRIRESSGQQFDPDIVREAIKIFKREEPVHNSARPNNHFKKTRNA